MSLKRYSVFALASLLVHALLAQAIESEEMTLAVAPSDSAPISVQMLPTVTKTPPTPAPEPKPVPKPEPKPVPKPEPKPVPKPVHKPVPKPITKPEPKPEPKPAPRPVPQPAPKPVPQPTPAPTPAIVPESAPEPIAQVAATHQPTVAKDSTPKRVENPSFKSKPAPVAYPIQARRRGQQGTVVVEVWLDEQGRQIKRFVAESSGVSTLDNAVLKGVEKYRFSPYLENGRAITHRVRVPITFKLD